MIHREAEELLVAGAVLDDLDPEERAAYDAHRATCIACRRTEVELDDVLADLSLAVPDRLPPPDLLAGIRRAIAAMPAADAGDAVRLAAIVPTSAAPIPGPASAPAATPAPAAAPAPTNVIPLDRARERRASRLMAASVGIAAVLGIVAVGLGVQNAGLRRDLDATAAQVSAMQSALSDQGSAMTVAMTPGHVTVPLHAEALAPGAHAAVMFLPGSTASYIVASNLPATPSGHGYQLWYADAAGVHPLETVSYDGTGAFVAPLGVDLAGSAAVMITLEPTGGSTGQPGPQVVFGEL